MHSSNRTQTQTPAVPATPSFQDRHGQLHRSFARIARPEAAAERAGTTTSQRVASFLLASSLALGLPLATLPLGAHAAPAAPVSQLAPQAQDDSRDVRQPGAGPEGRAKPGRGMEGRGEHHRRGPGGPDHLRGLQLSDAQQDQVFAIRHASAPELRQQSRAARQAQQQLRELSRADTFDAARAQALSQQAAQAQAAASLQMARDQHAIRAVLTPEQRTQLDARRTQQADAGSPPPRGERGGRGDRGERGAPRHGAEPPHAEPSRAEPSR